MALWVITLMWISSSTKTWSFVGLLPSGGLAIMLVPIGFGVGITMATTTLSAQYSVEPKDIGASSSIVQFMGSLGGGVILSILTVLVNTTYKNHLILHDSPTLSMTIGIREAFIVLFFLSVVAIASSFFMEGKLPVSSMK